MSFLDEDGENAKEDDPDGDARGVLEVADAKLRGDIGALKEGIGPDPLEVLTMWLVVLWDREAVVRKGERRRRIRTPCRWTCSWNLNCH